MLHALSLFYFLMISIATVSLIATLLIGNRLMILRALGLTEDCMIHPLPTRPLHPERHPRIVRTMLPVPDVLRAAA